MKTIREMLEIFLKLKSVPCMDCVAAGRDGIWPAVCMQFDHVAERGPKLGTVRQFLNDEEKFWIEVAKCDVVCSNCHAVRTSTRPWSEEKRRKYSDAQKISCNRPEIKAKKSARISQAFESPVIRQNLKDRMTRKWQDPEFRKKCADTRRRTAEKARAQRLRENRTAFYAIVMEVMNDPAKK